jgi:hypothetical protein
MVHLFGESGCSLSGRMIKDVCFALNQSPVHGSLYTRSSATYIDPIEFERTHFTHVR